MTVDDGNFVLHGAILYMKSEEELFETADGYLVCMEGVSAGVFEELPEEFSDWPLIDCPEELIIPGLVDTRADAMLANVRGLGTYLTDEAFAETYAEPEAKRIASDRQYEKRSFDAFIETIYVGPATRAIINGGSDFAAAARLARMLDETGLGGLVGLSCTDAESTAEEVLENAKKFLARIKRRRLANVKPALLIDEEKTSAALKEALQRLTEEAKVSLLDCQPPLRGRQADFVRAAADEAGSFAEFFAALTLKPGRLIGDVGTFAPGSEFDAVILSDVNLDTMRELTPAERLLRVLNYGDDRSVVGKFVNGWKVY